MVTNLRLPGQYDERLLASVGLQGPYYNWNRWYLPSVGRYLELDPIAKAGGFNGFYGPNWYGCAEGNPLAFFDSNALQVVPVTPVPFIPLPANMPMIPAAANGPMVGVGAAAGPIVWAAIGGAAAGTGIRYVFPVVDDWMQTALEFWMGPPGGRRRGHSDPPWTDGYKPFNPGRNAGGDCNPCGPNSPQWKTPGQDTCVGHQMVWDQNPLTCMCNPKRDHL